MLARLQGIVRLLVVGCAVLLGPSSASAQLVPVPPDPIEEQKRKEYGDLQQTWVVIIAGLVGIVIMIIVLLNRAEKREKKFADRNKQRKVKRDPDAPLPYEAAPAEPPPLP